MSSVRERIIVEAVNRIAQALAGRARVIRQPVLPVSRESSPAILIFVDSDTVTSRANVLSDRTLRLRCVPIVRGEAMFAEADDLSVRAHAALMEDANLSGLALSIRETDSEWNPDDADSGALSLPTVYDINYRSRIDDISLKG